MSKYLDKFNNLDPYKVREEFLVYKKHPDLCFLDSAASSLTPICVTNKLTDYLNYNGSNIHRGVYNLSYTATNEYELVRDGLSKFLNCKEDEIIFTKGATEALNLVASSYARYYLKKGDHVLTSLLEHHSAHLPFFNLENEIGIKLNYIDLDDEGRITFDNFKKAFTKDTKLVVLTHISNVMGYITPLKEIIDYAHSNGALVLVDACQSIAHLKIDLKELDCDFLAFSSHKMYGPNGVGVLYAKAHLLKLMKPSQFGGEMALDVYKDYMSYKEAPYKFEAGTPVIGEVIAFLEAINFINDLGYEHIKKHELMLRDLALEELLKLDNVVVYNKTAKTGLICFNIKGVHPHDAASIYDSYNVCLRAGYHCAQLIHNWLNVEGTLRASFSIYNTKEDVYKFIEATKACISFFC